MMHYSPDEVNLYLMDFKNGTEFKIYDSYRLPHIRLLAIDAMQEFGESILEELLNEVNRRSEQFKRMRKGNISVIMEQYINPALAPVFKDILEKLHVSGIEAAGKIVDHQ